tara:strand:+ start:439 stop:1020 length:582 start_codon:yes stop_codon:yes gene_type:complete
MHHIFVNDKPIILTTKVEKEDGFKNYLLKKVNIGKVIKKLNSTDLAEARLVGTKDHKLIRKFLKLLPNVVAGGGKVYNSNGEILFIYRNDKWDLPKGKTEKNESIEETSIREVEEETGVQGLEIVKPLDTTYHIFKRNGKHRIKVTYWFEMKTTFEGELYPQENEGITKVEWLSPMDSQKALENSYANIKLLV